MVADALSFQLWRREELVLLRRIARLAGAILAEPDDPAIEPERMRLAETLAELYAWRLVGAENGWQ